jgi:hypothetical protein
VTTILARERLGLRLRSWLRGMSAARVTRAAQVTTVARCRQTGSPQARSKVMNPLGLGQLGPGQIGPAQIGLGQIGPGQMRLGQMRLGRTGHPQVRNRHPFPYPTLRQRPPLRGMSSCRRRWSGPS